MPKVTVKDKTKVVKKWVEETPRRSTYYAEETPLAAAKWESETTAAAPNYKTAVAAADIGKRFSGGVKRVGAEKFARKVKDVGADRYGPGVTAAKEDYSKGVEWVLSAIAEVEVPARKPRGDPGNWNRSMKIGTELHKKRLSRLAAGVASS